MSAGIANAVFIVVLMRLAISMITGRASTRFREVVHFVRNQCAATIAESVLIAFIVKIASYARYLFNLEMCRRCASRRIPGID